MVFRKLDKCRGVNSQGKTETFAANFSFGITFLRGAHPERLLESLDVRLGEPLVASQLGAPNA